MFTPNQLPTPFFLGPDTLVLATNSTGPAIAGQVIANGYVLNTNASIGSMRIGFSGTPTGTVQLGIYSSNTTNNFPAQLLASTPTFAATTGVITKNFNTPLNLIPGLYWLAFLDTVADTIFGVGGTAPAGFYATVLTTATGLTSLPSTFGAASDNNVAMAFSALINNGWS